MISLNGKEHAVMAAVPPKPDPDPNDTPSDEKDPINLSMHVWVLRLWMLCALVIIAYAICNYLASWAAR
jgi:hypothetical protein